MKAAIRKGFLGYTLSLASDVSKPKFQADSLHDKDRVFLKVRSAAINPIDYKLPRAAGGLVVGIDVCGTVEEVGSNSNGAFQVGDLVYGKSDAGSLAEYTTAKTHEVAKYNSTGTPSSSDEEWKPHELAALNVAYQSALQCLQTGNIIARTADEHDDDVTDAAADADASIDKAVLVIGASGGCGVAAVQLCHAAGVSRIVAICSKKNKDLVTNLGSSIQVLDYTNTEELASFFRDNVGKFDCVLDAATSSGKGEDYCNKSTLKLLKNDVGEYTALNGSPSNWARRFMNKEKKNQNIILCEANTADLAFILKLLNKTKARPLTNIMPFSEEGLADAFKQLKGRRTKGKIVFNIS